jgi:hypothetical protein
MLAILLSAQTGLFDLSFGDSREDAIANLESQGFVVDSSGDTYITLSDPDNYYVDQIELVFADDSLENWYISYLYVDDEDIEELVMDALIGRHGDDYSWNDDMESYVWEFDNGNYVIAGWDYYDDYFYAEYYTYSEQD